MSNVSVASTRRERNVAHPSLRWCARLLPSSERNAGKLGALSDQAPSVVSDEARLVDPPCVDHLRPLQDPHRTRGRQGADVGRQLQGGNPASLSSLQITAMVDHDLPLVVNALSLPGTAPKADSWRTCLGHALPPRN